MLRASKARTQLAVGNDNLGKHASEEGGAREHARGQETSSSPSLALACCTFLPQGSPRLWLYVRLSAIRQSEHSSGLKSTCRAAGIEAG